MILVSYLLQKVISPVKKDSFTSKMIEEIPVATIPTFTASLPQPYDDSSSTLMQSSDVIPQGMYFG